MKQPGGVELIADELRVKTSGLAARDRHELSVKVTDPLLLGEVESYLHYVLSYMTDHNARIQPGETLAYGYWLTKFELGDDRFLHAWEYNAEATDFVPALTLTLTYWRDQHEICERFGAHFLPPRPDQLAVISEGVLEGDPLQGVRYPSPDHMSGWWLTTDRYNGDIKSLRREHLYHVTAARPDLARYVALPYGFRFDLAHEEDIWFDKDVAGQSYK